MKSVLQEFGLTKNEATIYLLLLDLGSASAGQLIKKSGFQSSVVYHLLGRLVEKGVVRFCTQNYIKYYSADDPQHFQHLLEQQEKEIIARKEKFAQILPELLQKKSAFQQETSVQVYSGKAGLKTAFNDILANAREYLVYGGTGNFSRLLPTYRNFFHAEKKRRGITQRNILFGIKDQTGVPGKTKYLNPKFNLPFSFIVYANKVLINIFAEEPCLCIVVTSETLAKAFARLFEDLWRSH